MEEVGCRISASQRQSAAVNLLTMGFGAKVLGPNTFRSPTSRPHKPTLFALNHLNMSQQVFGTPNYFWVRILFGHPTDVPLPQE
jgi:hypothetical protein